jgi:benzil reductase ((S)-benzoin forming)
MKKFFITGTSSGIGHALAMILLEDDKNEVVGISRSNNIEHSRFLHIPLDLEDAEAVLCEADRMFKDISGYEQVVLINNAGYLGEIRYIGELRPAEFIKVMNINVIAPAILMNAFINHLKKTDDRKVVLNIGSGAGRHPYDGWGPYCASKAAVDMLSAVADLENNFRERNIRIVSLAPGPVETGMQELVRSTSAKDFSQVHKFKSLKDSGNLPTAQEVADKIISFICEIDRFDGPEHDIRKININ